MLENISADYIEYVIEMQRNVLRDTKSRYQQIGKVARTKLQQVVSLAKRTVPFLEAHTDKAREILKQKEEELAAAEREYQRICDGMVKARKAEQEELDQRIKDGEMIDPVLPPLKFPPTPSTEDRDNARKTLQYREERVDLLKKAIEQGEDLVILAEQAFEEWKKTGRRGNIVYVEELRAG